MELVKEDRAESTEVQDGTGCCCGQTNEVLCTTEQALSLADVHLRLGVIYMKKGNRKAARASWERTLELEPEREDVRKLLRSLDEGD